MAKAVIFDYGVGNLLSLKTALEKAGLYVTIGTTSADLAKADAIALPGVGSFTAALEKLNTVKETLQTKMSRGHPAFGYLPWGCSCSLNPARKDPVKA